jgi:3-hydroxyisobutyrate dehydrogenase
VFTGDYDESFAMKAACKDLDLAIDLSRDVGVPASLSVLVEQRYRTAFAGYGDEAGEISPIRLYEEAAKIQLRLPLLEDV